MNLINQIKQRVELSKPKTLTRIKVGRALSFIAALPLCTSPLFILSLPMSMSISPQLWAKDRMRYFNEWRTLR